MSPPLELPLRRTRAVLLALLALGFVAGGVWFTAAVGLPSLDFSRNRAVDELLRAIGLAAVVFFGACFVVVAELALHRGPGLVIDDEGLVEHTSGTAAGRVRWEEITAIAARSLPGSAAVVAIDVADLDAHLDRLPAWRRWLVRSNVGVGASPVTIHVDMLGQDADALAALLLAERARRTGLPPLGGAVDDAEQANDEPARDEADDEPVAG